MLAEEQNDFGAPQHTQLAREAEPMCVGAEQLITKGVEGFDWGCGVAVRNEAIDAPLHLLRGALRKGECQDLFWLGTLFGDQPGNATCDDLGLPSSGTGDDEEWPLTVCDSGVLLVVEVINEMRDGWRCRRRSFGCDSGPDWELRSPFTLARPRGARRHRCGAL